MPCDRVFMCVCLRRHKVKFIQEVGCLILTCLALAACLALALALALAGLITSGLGAGAYNEALFVAQSLAPE